jgi:Mg-chelatase subunit ChlD
MIMTWNLPRPDIYGYMMHAGTNPPERVRLEASIYQLTERTAQVMLKVTVASSSACDRLGLDLVAVLDVSGEKLGKMKTAMHFIISKLSPMDRLCIVGTAEELQFVTKAARAKLKGMVDGMVASSMSDGLQMGLDVLTRGGRLGGARTASVLLMSDCKQQPRVVETRNVVVHTFGFGQDHDLTVSMHAIRSMIAKFANL